MVPACSTLNSIDEPLDSKEGENSIRLLYCDHWFPRTHGSLKRTHGCLNSDPASPGPQSGTSTHVGYTQQESPLSPRGAPGLYIPPGRGGSLDPPSVRGQSLMSDTLSRTHRCHLTELQRAAFIQSRGPPDATLKPGSITHVGHTKRDAPLSPHGAPESCIHPEQGAP